MKKTIIALAILLLSAPWTRADWFDILQKPGDVEKTEAQDRQLLQRNGLTNMWELVYPEDLGLTPGYDSRYLRKDQNDSNFPYRLTLGALTVDTDSTTALLVEQSGIKPHLLRVDTTEGIVTMGGPLYLEGYLNFIGVNAITTSANDTLWFIAGAGSNWYIYSGDLLVNTKVAIRETGAIPTKYTYFQGGDQAIDLIYTLPTAYPAEDYMPLLSTTAGIWSWGGDLTIGAHYQQFSEISTPPTPPTNSGRWYTKDDGSGESAPYFLSDAGIEYSMTGGGGGATNLPALTDVDDALLYINHYLLYADGSQYISGLYSHTWLTDIGTNTHPQIDTHIADNSIHPNDSNLVHKTGDETIAGIKTFTSFPVTPSSSPTTNYQVANKAYVDAIAAGLTWKAPVLDKDLSDPPGSPSSGDRYIVKPTGINAWAGHDNDIAEWNGSSWNFSDPLIGWAVITLDDSKGWTWDGSTWIQFSASEAYMASLGVKKVGNDFRLDYLINQGLVLSTNSLKVDYDDSSIGIVANKLAVKALGITNEMLAGLIADSKLLTISTVNKVDWVAVNKTGSAIDDIADVNAPAPSDDQALVWDATSSKWIPQTISGGSSSASTVYMPLYWVSMSSVAINGGIWTNMPVAETVFMGTTTKGIRKFDASLATQYRIMVWQTVAGYAGSDIRLQYSLDGSTGWTNADAAGTELDVGVGTGLKSTALLDLVAGAKGFVWFRLLGKQGNGTIDPAWSEVKVEFKVPGGDALTFSDTSSVDLTKTGLDITAVVLPAGVDHNSLLNYVANKHIDHTEVSIATTSPLAGGGDISATRTLALTQTAITNLNSALATGLLKITTTTGLLSSIIDNSSNWDAGYTYRLLSASGTAPLTLTLTSNALTGSMTQAATGANGWLSSTDWNTFNNKQDNLTIGNMTATSPILVDQTRQVIGGAVVFSHAATTGNIHLPTGGATGQIITYGAASGTGAWTTATYPATTLINQVLYSTAANVIGGSANLLFDGTTQTVGGTTNNVAQSATGTAYAGTARPQRSFYVDAAGMWPSTTSGCAAQAKAETATNKINYYYLAFDGATAENAEFSCPLPKTWNANAISYIVHYIPTGTTTGTGIVWGLKAVCIGDNVNIDTAYGTAVTVTDTIQTANYVHISPESSALTIAGTLTGEKPIHFKIYRDAAAAGDTNTNDAWLTGIMIKYTATQETDD